MRVRRFPKGMFDWDYGPIRYYYVVSGYIADDYFEVR